MTSVQPINYGDQITLDCEVTNANADEEVAWYHDGGIVSFGANILKAVDRAYYTLQVMQDSSTLTTYHWIITIADVDVLRDRGQWSCQLSQQEVVTDLLQIGMFFYHL